MENWMDPIYSQAPINHGCLKPHEWTTDETYKWSGMGSSGDSQPQPELFQSHMLLLLHEPHVLRYAQLPHTEFPRLTSIQIHYCTVATHAHSMSIHLHVARIVRCSQDPHCPCQSSPWIATNILCCLGRQGEFDTIRLNAEYFIIETVAHGLLIISCGVSSSSESEFARGTLNGIWMTSPLKSSTCDPDEASSLDCVILDLQHIMQLFYKF